MVEHFVGGILGALQILKDHWGAVGRDLAAAHWTWDQACMEMPFNQLIEFIVYSPPGTATFHLINQGWTADTHQLATLIDVSAVSMWLNTDDAHSKNPKHRPRPLERPGGHAPKAAPEPTMTVEQYMSMNGM